MVQLAQMEEQHPRFEHGGVRNDPLELSLTLLLQSELLERPHTGHDGTLVNTSVSSRFKLIVLPGVVILAVGFSAIATRMV